MKIQALVDRYGSNRMNATEPGKLLRGCSCVAIPFAGGMCEVPHITANVVLVNDLDRAVVNLAMCVADAGRRHHIASYLDAMPFHPEVLDRAQASCLMYARGKPGEDFHFPNDQWAIDYFIASWMTRGGKGGTDGEFDAGLSIRWRSGGGDSVVRFRNATEGLAEWEKVMRRCTFTCMDAFDFLAECHKRDISENGIYCDPPWVEDGDKYKHGAFDELVNWSDDIAHRGTPIKRITRHEMLARHLTAFECSRIVVRYGAHPLIRELYPESLWEWRPLNGRTQANKEKAEVLLVRRR